MDVDHTSSKAESKSDDEEEEGDDEEEEEEEEEQEEEKEEEPMEEEKAASSSSSGEEVTDQRRTPKRRLSMRSESESAKSSRLKVDDIVNDEVPPHSGDDSHIRPLSGRRPTKVDVILSRLKERFKYLCQVVDKVDSKKTGVDLLHAAMKVISDPKTPKGYITEVGILFQQTLNQHKQDKASMKEVFKYVEAVHQRDRN